MRYRPLSFDEYVEWKDSQTGVPHQPNRRRYLNRIKATWEDIYTIKLKYNTSNDVKNKIEEYLRDNHKLDSKNKFYSDQGQRRWYINNINIMVALKIKFGEYIERNDHYEGYGDYLEGWREMQRGNLSFQQGTSYQFRNTYVGYQNTW